MRFAAVMQLNATPNPKDAGRSRTIEARDIMAMALDLVTSTWVRCE